MKLSIIFPTRNEELLIKKTLMDVVSFLDQRKISDYEILVVINGTQDKTKNIVAELEAKNTKIKIFESEPGVGKALRVGLRESRGEYVVVFDVDFYELRMIDFINVDLLGKDFIIGSKMTSWAEDKRPLSRKIVSKVFNLFLKVVLKFKGSDTHGTRILRRKVIKLILPECKTDSGIFDTEFILRSQYADFKFADFPVTVVEKRPPRFTQRVLQTPKDIYELYTAMVKS
jgi:glycosyltransferase involved in cell wall biosynthesis